MIKELKYLILQLIKNKLSKNLKGIITFILVSTSFYFLISSKANASIKKNNNINNLTKINWSKLEIKSNLVEKTSEINKKKLDNWEKIDDESKYDYSKKLVKEKKNFIKLSSMNRSVVFNNMNAGPDIGWIVPSGFKWNKNYKFDFYARGHNTKIPEPKNRNFFGWNDGDAVGLISYQFLHREKSSFGLNLGIRSVYYGDEALGGNSKVGEGLSGGFRWDYELSDTSGIAFGAEQLIHFDNKTDTGRNLYLIASKGWWSDEYKGIGLYPLYVATGGFGTGRMAVGTVKGFCSGILGGSGTETQTKRNLCWSPIFSLAGVWNEQFSSFFEYNSRFFLLGSSIVPIKNIPMKGSLALILSDHVDNYKLHDFSELNWVFNISVGF